MVGLEASNRESPLLGHGGEEESSNKGRRVNGPDDLLMKDTAPVHGGVLDSWRV